MTANTMPIRLSSLLPLLVAGTALAACGGSGTPAPEARKQLDPAIVAALADPLMIDPDLASQNRGNAAITLDTFGAVPLDDASPEAIAAAKTDAARLAGGMIKTAPDAAESGATPAPALTAGQLAAALPALPAGCVDSLRFGYAWAANMPPALPIYPRGHVQEAAGSTACGVRAVVFTTPVEASAVIAFYFTRAGDAGFTVERRRQAEVDALSGRKNAAAFVVRIRSGTNGLSEVELATRN
jgi:hypothetical protein